MGVLVSRGKIFTAGFGPAGLLSVLSSRLWSAVLLNGGLFYGAMVAGRAPGKYPEDVDLAA